jgi:hypothetical protein
MSVPSAPTPLSRFVDEILNEAIAHARREAVSVYTFALYHDHESAAVSVCIDTEESSRRRVEEMNRYSKRHFAAAVTKGDLDHAALWQANVGRSLSLGDFAMVNVARRDLGRLRVTKSFYVTLVRCVSARESEVLTLSRDPERLVFCCSGADDEVGYVWSGYADE